jgi:glycosyltransferase involved in cell wall biosynthesis
VPFTARHDHDQMAAILREAGVDPPTVGRAVVLPLPRPVLYEAWLRLGWPRLPPLGGAQLVHAPSVAVPPRSGVPLVVTVHDAAPERFPEAFPARGRRFHRQGLAAAARRADQVLTVSAAAAEEIATFSTIPPDRIRVVHNGIDPPALSPERRRAILEGWGLADRPYVLWVGSLEPRKGVDTLVAAMARLRSRRAAGPAAHPQLVLAGYPGWLSDDLLAPHDRAVLGSELRQLGSVGEAELWSLYGGAAVFAFPSRHEGFGLPVLEAMSQGTAVVASDIPAIREIAGGGARLVAAGDVDAWADAIEDLLGDEGQRHRLGAAGRVHAAGFGIDRTIRATRAVYRELLGG